MSDKLIDYPRDDDPEKVIVRVEVTGRPTSGSRYIAQIVANALWVAGIETAIQWGLEGEPNPSEERRVEILKAISNRTKVLLVETQAPRKWDPNV